MENFNPSSTVEVDTPFDVLDTQASSESPTPQTFEELSQQAKSGENLEVPPEITSPHSSSSDISETRFDIENDPPADAHNFGTVLLLKTSQIQVNESRLSRIVKKFDSKGFEKLNHDISVTRVNIDPITVRLLPSNGAGREPQYELVSGYFRLQACANNKLEVLAVVISAPRSQSFDVDLFKSNLHRQSLSAYESGLQMRRILNAGYVETYTRLADEIGASKSQVSRSLNLADLPAAVIAAFLEPRNLRLLDGPALTRALEKDAEEVLAEASRIVAELERPDEREVVKRLLAAAGMRSGVARCNKSQKLIVKDRVVGNLTVRNGGEVEVLFSISISERRQTRLKKKLEDFLDYYVEDVEAPTDDVVANNDPEKTAPPM